MPEPAELFVKYIQPFLPSFFVRLLVRYYLFIFIGWKLRSADVVVQQLELDRKGRATAPVTTSVEVTNDQLYANDPNFFLQHLGPKLKYSACQFPSNSKANTADPASCANALKDAEQFTIANYQYKLELESLKDGSRVLELGCGWGSLLLTNAERYPKLKFTGFSNSPQQIQYITDICKTRKLKNVTVQVEDYAVFVTPSLSKVAPADAPLFDAAIAIETIEHAQNIKELLTAVAVRLRVGGRLFVHSLLHQSCSYLVPTTSWMGRNFFTGGSILSLNSYCHLTPESLYLADVQPISGSGYAKTLVAWLHLLEKNRGVFVANYGSDFYEGFRMFYIVCAEAFDANDGAEYMCGYYTWIKR